MDIFKLFRFRDWSAFRSLQGDVQRDLTLVLSIHEAATLAIRGEVSKDGWPRPSPELGATRVKTSAAEFIALASELYVCLLATGLGKTFSPLKWSVLASGRVTHCLGFLAMIDARGFGNGDIDVQTTGYSADPDEAMLQFAVVAASRGEATGPDSIRRYVLSIDGQWNLLRRELFEGIPGRLAKGGAEGPKSAKELLRRLSPEQRSVVLEVGASLAERVGKERQAAQEPFDAEKFSKEHPFVSVPFPKLVGLMKIVSDDIALIVRCLHIDDGELRRISRAKDLTPSSLLNQLLATDAKIVGYAILMAAVEGRDSQFRGCKVWQMVAKTFEKEIRKGLAMAVLLEECGWIGDAPLVRSLAMKNPGVALDRLIVCRTAASDYLGTGAHGREGDVSQLFRGTAILRHVLNHPKHGKYLKLRVPGVLETLDTPLTRFAQGELMNYKDQEQRFRAMLPPK